MESAGAKVPFLNDYKKTFFWKRFPQTLLGGLNLRPGCGAPVCVYLLQIIIFLSPWILGGCFTALVAYQVFGTHSYVILIIYGVLIGIFVIIVQLGSFLFQKRKPQIIHLTNTAQFFSDEEEVDFEGGFSPEVVKFIFPVKKFKLNIVLHACIAGVMCALGLWYLVPSNLHALYGSAVITIIIYPIGWIVICIAQYSLSVIGPPEPATFRATDFADIMSLMRPTCVMIFLVVDLLWRYFPSELQLTNQILHIIFLFLPLLWASGVLPPVEALVLWLMEQILIHLLGGSAMATNLRLFMMLFLSCISLVVAFLLPSSLALIIFSSIVGYLLSLDWGGCFSRIHTKFRSKIDPKDQDKFSTQIHLAHSGHWVVVVFYHVFFFLLTGIASSLIHHFSNSIFIVIYHLLGFSIVSLIMLTKFLEQLQKVYIFGFKRNWLFPKNVDNRPKFNKRKRRLRVLVYIYRFFTDFVLPVLMVSYLSLVYGYSSSSPPSFWLALGCTRAYRWVWQSTSDSALEIAIIHTITTIFFGSTPSRLLGLEFGLQLMLTSFVLDRLRQVVNKSYCFWIILITSYSVKKQRRSSTVPMILVLIVFFPVTFVVIVVAGLLSAPVLLLFTLPILLVGFPRPLRSWPGKVGGSASTCTDSMYYREMMPELCKALRKALASGSLGTPRPGSFFLLRFQDRMAWIQVLERGHSFYSFSIKGMELQETSCHTVEAGELEAQFQVAFENEHVGCCSFNPYLGHTMVPVDVLPITTYSDAKNILTGVIDSPETLEKIDEGFIKALVWVMLRHNSQKKDYSPRKSPAKVVMTPKKEEIHIVESSNKELPQGSPVGSKTFLERTVKSESKDSGHPESAPSRPHSVISAKLKMSTSWSSLGSWGDDKSVELNVIKKRKPVKTDEDESKSIEDSLFEDLPGMVNGNEDKLLKELETFGLPALDAEMQSQNATHNIGASNLNQGMGIQLGSSLRFKSHYSSRLSLPLKWREIPMDASSVRPVLDRFPKEWFSYILTHLKLGDREKSSEEVAKEICEDAALVEMYTHLVMACYSVVNVDSLTGQSVVSAGPSHVYRVYSGDIPWSPSREWLDGDGELLTLVIKAYRLAFKLAYDQVVLGEGDDLEDIAENLEDYEESWYLGNEKDAEWTEAVIHQKPFLFSLMFDNSENVYKGRVLSRAPIMAYLGSLNQEMVRALWSSLSMELLYMTNDDEERYSIQAHPVILRNLTVQAADPPLGYPIYASPPISLPII